MLVSKAFDTSSGKKDIDSVAAMAKMKQIFSKKLVGANDAQKSIPWTCDESLVVIFMQIELEGFALHWKLYQLEGLKINK
eukprot:11668079-Ditylum_brightwellii.AAC.1